MQQHVPEPQLPTPEPALTDLVVPPAASYLDGSAPSGPSIPDPMDPLELARERVSDFSFSFISKGEEERASFAREFYAALSTPEERLSGAQNLGGGRFYRVEIPRDVALEALGRLIHDEDGPVQAEALAASWRLEAVDLYARRVLELSDSRDPHVREAALQAMERGSDQRFLDRLRTAMSEPEPRVRCIALDVLSRLLPDERAAAELAGSLNDASPQVRTSAVQNLAPLAFRGRIDLLDKLIARVHDVDREVAVRALNVLAACSPPLGASPSVLGNALASKLHSEDAEARAMAGGGLAHLRAGHYFPGLIERLRDPAEDAMVRKAIVVHLHGGDSKVFKPVLADLLRSPDLDVDLRSWVKYKLNNWSRGAH